MKMTTSRSVLSAGAAAGAVLLIYSFLPKPVSVETARSERTTIIETIDEEADTRVRERYDIAAPVAGTMSRITVHAGDLVHPGDVVATLVPAPVDPREEKQLRARLSAAEQALRAAQAQMSRALVTKEHADRERDRVLRLQRDGIASKESGDAARTTAEQAARELDSAKFRAASASYDVDVARAAVQFGGDGENVMTLRAPVAGRVLRVLRESESVVATGTTILQIGDPSTLEIVIPMLSSDAVKASVGSKVIIDDWGGDRPLAARVRLIEPSAFTKISALGVEEQRVNVIADFNDPEVPLGDGYRAEARVITWQGSVLAAPSTALFRVGDEWATYVVRDARSELRKVTIGHRSDEGVEIRSGLKEGETLILHPSDRVHDGGRVKLEE